MKTLLLSSTLILFTYLSALAQQGQGGQQEQNREQAQEQKNEKFQGYLYKKHEINIGISGLFNNNLERILVSDPYVYPLANYAPPQYYTFKNPAMIGVGYKYHFDNSAIRSQINFGVRNASEETTPQNQNFYRKSTTESNYSTMNARVGFEFIKKISKVDFYVGGDLLFGFSDLKTKSTTEYVPGQVTPETQTFETSENYVKYGISPFLGVRYFLVGGLSIGIETRIDVINETGTKESSSNGVVNTNTTTSGFNAGVDPIGLISVNLHL